MGELQVPAGALWVLKRNEPCKTLRSVVCRCRGNSFGHWTNQRGCGWRKPAIRFAAGDIAAAIEAASLSIAEGNYDEHFPVDIFQTGSGTSSNMNANEVIAHLASKTLGKPVHANDQVNMCQSSNDVIPTCIHVSASLSLRDQLVPALIHLAATIARKAKEVDNIVTTGRTHLMDAMPITLSQELSSWAKQVELAVDRLHSVQPRLQSLALGGTAVGTGVNAHPISPRSPSQNSMSGPDSPLALAATTLNRSQLRIPPSNYPDSGKPLRLV